MTYSVKIVLDLLLTIRWKRCLKLRSLIKESEIMKKGFCFRVIIAAILLLLGLGAGNSAYAEKKFIKGDILEVGAGCGSFTRNYYEPYYISITLTDTDEKNISTLKDIFQQIAKQDANVVITTDHGTINVNRPSRVIGDRNVNTNLRYKQGKNLDYQKNDVFEIEHPLDYFLPIQNVSSKYIFAKEDMYFVYQNNYNQFVNLYKNTYQHGGISMQEMLIPIITLKTK